MLTITNKALAVVRAITAHPKLDESSGLRIASQRGTSRLGVGAVEKPQPGDVVVERSGGRVYIGRNVVRRLHGRVLDVRKDALGRAEFLLKAA